MKATLFLFIMAVFTLTGSVTLAGEPLPALHQVEVVSTWESLGDTAVLEVPRTLRLGGRPIADVVQRGDTVTIAAGYAEYGQAEIFRGYVTRIFPGTPLRLEAQDDMYKLKQGTYNLSYKSLTLPQLIADIAPGYQTKVRDVQLGSFLIRDASAAQVLRVLGEKYSLPAYFRQGVLYVGAPYMLDEPPVHTYDFRLLPEQSDLEWRSADDYKLQVRAISILGNKQKLEVTVGEAGGETRTMHFAGIETEAALRELAEARLTQVRVEGLAGTMRTFGVPLPRPGDIANLLNNPFNDLGGRYYIDRVTTLFGSQSGYMHKLQLGQRAA